MAAQRGAPLFHRSTRVAVAAAEDAALLPPPETDVQTAHFIRVAPIVGQQATVVRILRRGWGADGGAAIGRRLARRPRRASLLPIAPESAV